MMLELIRSSLHSFTVDVARAVIVGGNEVDERSSRSKDMGKRTQANRKADIIK